MFVERWPGTRKAVLLIGLCMTSCVTLMYYCSTSLPFDSVQIILTDSVDDSFFVKTPGCRISRLDPFDPSISAFLEGFPLDCSLSDKGGPPLLILTNDSNSATYTSNAGTSDDRTNIVLSVVESAFAHYNISAEDRGSLESRFYCIWEPFHRKTPNPEKIDRGIDNSIQYGAKSEAFNRSASIPPGVEFLRCRCFLNETKIYEDFLFIPSGNPSFFPPTPSPSNGSALPAHQHSVLIFSLDAVSRLNFIREMPLLHRFFKDHGAIDFIGYHKVGDNTFPNLVPLMAGLSEDDIGGKGGCWENRTFFDACPFLWKQYKSEGFTTAFIEDDPSISGFNYLKKGFNNQPTDYYLRPLYKEAEEALGHSAHISSNTKLCMGHQLNIVFLLGVITQFLLAFPPQRRKFGFFWENSLTHDNSNFPRLGDKIYQDFFRGLADSGILEKTFVLLLSDHGLRWGSIRNTYQGRIEERMPMFFLLPPPSFKNEFPLAYQNLKRNINKLTTPYDVHATLLDLLDYEKISDAAILEREEILSISPPLGAYSLFTPVSSSRDCASARISADYCACHDAVRSLDVSDPSARSAAFAAVAHINALLGNNSLCSTLHLHRVRDVKVERSLTKTFKDADGEAIEFFSVALETVPGNGIFEATLRRRGRGEGRFQVVGTVSRTNLYRGQSECVQDYRLRLYCYCV